MLGVTYEICVIQTDQVVERLEECAPSADLVPAVAEEAITIEKLESESEKDEAEDEAECSTLATVSKIPAKLLDNNNMLLIKGQELMDLMSQFFVLECELCSMKFGGIRQLLAHQKETHQITPYISCCSMKLTKLPGIIWHFVRHIEPEAFRCNICDYSVSRPKFLERHIQTHADPSEKQFSCDLCDKRFIWKGALRSHLLNHQPEAERQDFACNQCERKYLSAGALSWHKKRAHSTNTQKPVKNLCEVCSKSFATLTSFKEHMLIHSEDCDKMQLQCQICSKWLKNQRCLKSHMLLHASVDYNCTECSYTTKKESLLKNHIITRHTSERPFACDECEKTFKVKRALTVHKAQSHTEGGNTGRTCEFCGKHFGSSTNYYTHRKNLHAEELQQALAQIDEHKKRTRIKIGLETP